jgi:hypothetical protein
MAIPNPLPVSLSPLTQARLEALADAEYFGGNARQVAKRFIEDGIRQAAKDGWLGDVTRPIAASSPPTDETQDE